MVVMDKSFRHIWVNASATHYYTLGGSVEVFAQNEYVFK